MILENLDIKNKCTGCTACESVCRTNAIKMEKDEKGFFRPCIDIDLCCECGLCDITCPQLNYTNDNYSNPDCYAIKAKDDILAVSSSGGAFSLIAEYVFKKNGYVCGAAFDNDFKGVSHIIINNRNYMYKLRGSKYVYSKTEGIFVEVKKILSRGEYLLFSGTPCQVAGLKSYLNKAYSNLITVDFICSGVPSEKVFSKYVKNISNNREIKSINMRPKKYGWDVDGIDVDFKDGSNYMIHCIRDPYLKGFLNKLFNNEACYDCKFAVIPRVADFTIGDFWHLDEYFMEENFSDGISCILTNNEKAIAIFDDIKNFAGEYRKVKLSFLKSHNMMIQHRRKHLAEPRFYKFIDEGMPFGDAVRKCLRWQFDIALTGCWTVPNYGGELTYYAFYKLLKDMGKTVIMVERRFNRDGYDIPIPTLFRNNPYPYYDVSRIHKNFNDQSELNNRVSTFILGSDQVWNYRFMREEDINSYNFDYVKDYRKIISYSTSFGSNKFTGNNVQRDMFNRLIKRFDYISVREESGKGILKSEFDIDNSVVTIDPIFLCDKKHLLNLLEKAEEKTIKGKYLFTYFIIPYHEKYGFFEIAEKLNMSCINTINADVNLLKNNGFSKISWKYSYESNLFLEEWLNYLYNSSFIITDSFHGVCLSLIFHKTFVFIKGNMTDDDGLERVSSLLGKLGLSERIVQATTDILKDDSLLADIDYEKVDITLNKLKNDSMNWLLNALETDIMNI